MLRRARRSIWTPERKKTSIFPRWAMSKNSLEPKKTSPSRLPGSRSCRWGAWVARASRAPAVGMGELTPTPTRSPSRRRRLMTAAISSSAVYRDRLQVGGRRRVRILVGQHRHDVDVGRRYQLLAPRQGVGGARRHLVDRHDHGAGSLDQEPVIERGLD